MWGIFPVVRVRVRMLEVRMRMLGVDGKVDSRASALVLGRDTNHLSKGIVMDMDMDMESKAGLGIRMVEIEVRRVKGGRGGMDIRRGEVANIVMMRGTKVF